MVHSRSRTRKNLIFIFNWHPSNALPDYEIPLKETGDYRVVLNTDDKAFGGFDRVNNTLNYPSYIIEDKVFMKIYNVNRAALVLEKVTE